MASKRVMMRVLAEVDCPLFRAGDHMLLDLPYADKNGSTALCALTIAKFLEEVDLTPCEGAIASPDGDHFSCPRQDNPVTFTVEEIEPRRDPEPLIGNLKDNLPAAVAMLRGIPIFRALPAVFLGQLAHRIRLEHYAEGDEVIQKGHASKGFYIVNAGELEVIGYAEHGVSSVMTKLKHQDCFGEMSLLTNAPAAATVTAKGDVSLLALDHEDFELLLRENPFMASRFTRLLAARLMAANYLLVQEGSKSFSGKLSVMGLATVLQVLADSARSGTLKIKDYSGNKGRIGFCEGRVHELTLGDIEGEDALLQMIRWEDGDFWLDPGDIPTEDTVQAGITGLLLDAMRRLDEENR